MKTSLLMASVLALCAGAVSQAADLDGHWARGDGKAKVRIAQCGADICATNTWIKPGTPNEKAGDLLVLKVRETADGQYSGSAFDPQRDKSFRITLDVGDSKVVSKGCVLGGLLCKDVGWTRIE